MCPEGSATNTPEEHASPRQLNRAELAREESPRRPEGLDTLRENFPSPEAASWSLLDDEMSLQSDSEKYFKTLELPETLAERRRRTPDGDTLTGELS